MVTARERGDVHQQMLSKFSIVAFDTDSELVVGWAQR
jgi:hypothetical protein